MFDWFACRGTVFCLVVNCEGVAELRLQFATGKAQRGGRGRRKEVAKVLWTPDGARECRCKKLLHLYTSAQLHYALPPGSN